MLLQIGLILRCDCQSIGVMHAIAKEEKAIDFVALIQYFAGESIGSAGSLGRVGCRVYHDREFHDEGVLLNKKPLWSGAFIEK